MRVEPTAFIVDDDPDVREALQGLLGSVAIRAETYGSVEAFVASGRIGKCGCLVLDVRLTGQSGLAFQTALARMDVAMPIIFISGHADVPMAVQAMKDGALEFLIKPVRPQDLIDAIQQAFLVDQGRRARIAALSAASRAYASLTPRERDVLELVVAGKPNKRTASQLGITEATVKAHRSNIMRKLDVGSVAELVRINSEFVALNGAADTAPPAG
jgi:FixJ family two-component response regulator